jgi:hypothetical protein
MASITPRPQVVEIEPQVRSLDDGDFMVCMEMTLTPRECAPQFFQDIIGGRYFETSLAKDPDDIRLPFAIHTAPAVTLEAQDPEPTVVSVVPALSTVAATFVMFTLPRAAVLFAGSAGCECGTAWGRARVEYSDTRSRSHRGSIHYHVNSNRALQSSTVDFRTRNRRLNSEYWEYSEMANPHSATVARNRLCGRVNCDGRSRQ